MGAQATPDQELVVRDQERIQRMKQVRMLRSVLSDCQQIKQELKTLLDKLTIDDDRRTSQSEQLQLSEYSDLLKRVRELLCRQDLSKLAASNKSLKELVEIQISSKPFAKERAMIEGQQTEINRA